MMLDCLIELPERRPAGLIAAIGLVFCLAYGASLVWLPKPSGRIVVGDAVHFYVYLRSVVFDGDVRFQNEYARLYNVQPTSGSGFEWVFTPLPTGHVRNLMPIGPAIVWAPLYLLVTLAVAALGLVGVDYPLDGYGRLFQAAAGFSGIAAATGGVFLAYRAATRLFSTRCAIWSTLAMWFGSSALYYSVISPTYSHAPSMLATGLLVWHWLGTRHRSDLWRYAQLGGLAGFAALVRWQDATWLIIPALEAMMDAGPGASGDRRAGRAATRIAVAVGAALLVFTPQMAAWNAIYGSPLVLPQGEGFMRWGEPALASVLLSDWHGLFTWTPVVAVAVAGVAGLWRRDRSAGVAAVAVLISAWYVNAAVADWWAGEAFGSRRFLSCFPFFVLGLCAVIARWDERPRFIAVLVVIAVALNGLLLFQYQLFMKGWRDLAPYPRGWYGLWLARFWVPVRVLVRWFGL
jgi:hypothetical protein